MKIVHHLTISALALSLGWLPLAISQSVDTRQTSNSQALNNAPLFSSQEIDAILAPIALYPDALLSQVLMASTYPLEVVQAARWSKSNNNKGGDAAVSQVSSQPWDPSVQSLVAFPQVLAMMSDQLDWTQKLGDAFLAQQADVMDSVQRLRRQAQQAGNLNSNAQQTVVTQGQIVVIEPAQPNVIYVPAYNPTIVYGAWPAPAYPPVYYPGVSAWYPGQSFVNGLMWGTGVVAAGAIFGGFNWNNHDVNINVNNYNRLNHNNFYNGTGNNWRHNPQHRGTVAYRDNASRQRYSSSNAGATARNDYRGHAPVQTAPPNRAAASATNRGAQGAIAASQRDAVQNRDRAPAAQQRDAFKGVDSGRQQIDRGRASSASADRGNRTQSQITNRSGGGAAAGSRGGGNRGGGNRRG